MDTNKIDVDALFKQYSIKEIQAIELQVKNEIEKKKEDLRIMVYNRYRDIIDAADGIHVMKNCSHQIETVLSELQGTCENVFSGKENLDFANQSKQRLLEKTKRNNKYVLAVIIKILQNSPSKIWYHLDNHDYLKAAKQYLIAQHAHICLEAEKSLKTQDNSSVYIQYANELWNSIVFLSHTIVNKSRSTLVGSDKNVSSKVLIDAISAIYLLENNTSLKKLFQEFVSSRTKIICSSIEFDPNDTASSINERIVGCLKTFVYTVFHFYDLFSSENENKSESFETLINDMSFTIETLKDDGVVVSKIPPYLKNIKFKDTEQSKRFDSDFLVKNATQWLNSCLSELKAKVASAFMYANNLKSLVLIRDSVLQFELSLLSNSAVSVATTFNFELSWERVCDSLFKQKIPIWSGLISQFYYSQSKLIIETLFQSTHESLIKKLQECLISISNDQRASSELDINSYLWSSDISNILNATSSTSSNLPGGQDKHQINFFSNQSTQQKLSRQSSLSWNKPSQNYSTKQHTTPSIAKLCKQLDEDLARLISDIEFSTSSSLNDQQSSVNADFNIASILSVDLKNFNEYLQESLLSFGNNMCESLMSLIEKLKSDEAIKSNSGRKFSLTETIDLHLNVKQILLICRLAHAIPYNCPNLKLCFVSLNQQLVQQQRQQLMKLNSQEGQGNSPISSFRKTAQQSDQKIIYKSKIVSDENWIKQTNRFREILKAGFNIWIQSLCAEIEDKYLKNLLNHNLNENVNFLTLDELIAWDEIDIEEELGSNMNDDYSTKPATTSSKGDSYKSKLNVPSVCSAFIQGILYNVSQQLTKNLSYTMIDSNLILKKLILSIFDLILDAYRKLLDSQNDTLANQIKLTQNQSLQFLFDLKFLASLFDLKSLHFLTTSNSSDEDNLSKLLSKVSDEYKSICAELESLVDPFDYDICLPFIQSNISKSISRSVALYGIISINEKQLKNVTTVNTTSSSEKFNLLVLSNNQQRFELLPLASQQSLNQQAQMQQMQFKNQISMKYDDGMKRNLSKPSSADTGSASGGIFGFKWF